MTGGLPRDVRAGYALGGVATGAFGTVPGLLLLPYLTERLAVGAALAGVIVFAPKAWDVVLNPVAGRVSDRRGDRRPFLIRAGLLLAVLFALLFAGPSDPGAAATAWVAVVFLACATAYAFFQVPYVAMPAEMTAEPAERTRLMTWRVAVLAFAILVSGGLAPAIRDAAGYAAMGAFVGALIALGAVGAWRGTRRAPTPTATAAGGSLREQLAVVRADRDFRALLQTFVVQALGIGVLLAGVDYVARHALERPSAASILFVCFVGPALLCAPLWQRLGERVGKRPGYVACSLVLVAGTVALLGARVLPAGATFAAAALVGVGYAGAQLFPLSMLPDVAAADAERTGENRIGVFTGIWTAGETLGLALGPAVYGVVLAIGGYVSSSGDATVAQPDSAITAIVVGFAALPALLVLSSLALLRGYGLRT